MSTFNKLKNRKGFTLIELIVVISILGILVLLAVPNFLGYTKDANVAAMQADAKVISNAALIYNIENDGVWPLSEEADAEVDIEASSELENYTTDTDNEDAIKELTRLDEDAIAPGIKNTKNSIDNYAIVTEGDLEGEVIYIGNDQNGMADKEGNIWFGVSVEIEATP